MRGRYLDVDLVLLVRIHRGGLLNKKPPKESIFAAMLSWYRVVRARWGDARGVVELFGFSRSMDLVTSQGGVRCRERWGTGTAGGEICV